MIDTPAPAPAPAPTPRHSHFHGLSFLLVLLNSLGLLGGLLAGLLLLTSSGLGSMPRSELGTMLVVGWILAFGLALLLPGLVFGIRRLAGREKPAFTVRNTPRLTASLAILWLGLMAGAYFLVQNWGLPVLLQGPLQIIAIGIPIWLLVEIGRRGLPGSKAHQGWGVFSAGMLISMPLAFLIETVLVILVVALAANAIMGQEALLEELNRLVMRLGNANLDPEVISRALTPILRKPAVLATILLTTSGLVPLVEELFKPLGMWALSRKKLTPAQGFNLGMVSGAAFALLESLGYLAGVTGVDWVWTAGGRVGSALLHITCSGLVGWGLAEAWSRRRFARLALAYAAAVAFHGLWNLFGILVGLVPFIDVTAGLAGFLRGLGVIAPYALVVTALGLLGVLVGMNLYLRRQSALELAVEPQMPAAVEPVVETAASEAGEPEILDKENKPDEDVGI